MDSIWFETHKAKSSVNVAIVLVTASPIMFSVNNVNVSMKAFRRSSIICYRYSVDEYFRETPYLFKAMLNITQSHERCICICANTGQGCSNNSIETTTPRKKIDLIKGALTVSKCSAFAFFLLQWIRKLNFPGFFLLCIVRKMYVYCHFVCLWFLPALAGTPICVLNISMNIFTHQMADGQTLQNAFTASNAQPRYASRFFLLCHNTILLVSQ